MTNSMRDPLRERPRFPPHADGAAHGGADATADGVANDAADSAADDGRLAPESLGRETAAVAARLRPVCGHWEAADFDAFVERLARTRLRWADRGDTA